MCRPGRPGQLDTGLGLGCRGVHARGLGSPDPLVLGATSPPPKPWSPPTIFMASSHCGPKLGLRKGGRQRAATGAPPFPELATHSRPSLSPSEGPAETGPRSRRPAGLRPGQGGSSDVSAAGAVGMFPWPWGGLCCPERSCPSASGPVPQQPMSGGFGTCSQSPAEDGGPGPQGWAAGWGHVLLPFVTQPSLLSPGCRARHLSK